MHSNKNLLSKSSKKHSPCYTDCCIYDQELDCCTPQFLILDKLRQGWSDVSTTGEENIPKKLLVEYDGYNPILSDISGTSFTSTASVKFKNVYDRSGNKVLFPGNGDIKFNYKTYLDPSGNSNDFSIDWVVTNVVYGNALNLGTVDAEINIFGKYYAYFYYTIVDGSGSFQICGNQDANVCADAITSIKENLYQGWRGLTWEEYIKNQIPYSGNSTNNENEPDYGFGNSDDGVYTMPCIVPTKFNEEHGSFCTILDNTLWAYLFVNTHRYVGIESCGKLDQVLGWYVNVFTNQLVLLQNLPELGLTTQDNLASLINTDYVNLNPSELKKLKELNKFYDLSLIAINKVKNNLKECGNIVVVEHKCLGKWLVAINNAKSNLCWSDYNGEFVIVMSKLC